MNAPAFKRERLRRLNRLPHFMVALVDLIGHWSTRINALTLLLLLLLFIGGIINWETLTEKMHAFFAILGM